MTRRLAVLVASGVLAAGTALSAASAAQPSRFDACDALAAKGLSADVWRCFQNAIRRTTGRVDDEAVLRVHRLLIEHADDGSGWFFLASLARVLGRDDAATFYRTAAERFAARGDAGRVARARIEAADLLMRRARLQDAETELTAAAAAMAGVDAKELRARLRVAQGWLAYRQGDYGAALRRWADAEPDLFPGTATDLQAQWLSGMGAVTWATAELERAMGYYTREAELMRQQGNRFAEASPRVNMVLLAKVLERPVEERTRLARDALQIAEAGGNRVSAARAHQYLAELSQGRAALAHAQASLALFREANQEVPLGLRTLAFHLGPFDSKRAFELADEAIALARRQGDLDEVARGWVTRSHISRQLGPRDQAIADSLAAFDAIEATRDLQPEGLVRAQRFSNWANPYRDTFDYVLSGARQTRGTAADVGDSASRAARNPAIGDIEQAFGIVERVRARLLLDVMDAARATPALSTSGPAAGERQRVLDEIVQVQRRLTSPALSEADRTQALGRLGRLEREEEDIRSRLFRRDPRAGLARLELPSARDLRATLGADEAFLTVAWNWVFVHTQGGTRAWPIHGDVSRAAALVGPLVERRDGAEAAGAARFYRDVLARPIAELPVTVSRLVISPDAHLQAFPFNLLRPSESDTPLAARYEVSLAPSAATWIRWRRTPVPPAARPVVVVADPAVGSDRSAAPERQWAFERAAPLGRLPYARREARSVAAYVSGVATQVGQDATEARLKRTNLSEFGILHFATHAVVDDTRPDRSAIVLAPGAAGEDGLLQVREIVDLDLAGRVVLLSACRSASGLVVGGEGMMSLAHAFFQAGARAVVASLWPLRDDEAAAFFDPFYRELGAGQSVAAALAAARRARIRAGAPAAAWAGIVVFGDGGVAPLSAGTGPPAALGPLWVLAVTAALLVVFPVALQTGRRRG
jgi:CHAT domain-containing protein/tetratricopeptide (TPR) repeat protein